MKEPRVVPRLISVNVGRPRVIELAGHHVTTGIFKEPVASRVRIGRTNVEGDSQADLLVHGGPDKAVYAYDLSAYAHWRAALARDLDDGTFGENLTVEGLPETEVRIDDVYRVGTARLQVTQPRSPCYKLSLRMGLPDFGVRFLESRRTGFYLRVLEEGEVGAGDAILLESRDRHAPTIDEIVRREFGV
ncbi:MAG TPA: MOSC domain-containing protein [Thermoanaerobaculia bacterium]|nr:MOSC domain-containing protein [Thermoanaerobaculia bacterium]